MNKKFLKNSKDIKKYLKILERVSKYAPAYRKRYKLEKEYAMKYNSLFVKKGGASVSARYIPPHRREKSKWKLSNNYHQLLRNKNSKFTLLELYNKLKNVDKGFNNTLINKNEIYLKAVKLLRYLIKQYIIN